MPAKNSDNSAGEEAVDDGRCIKVSVLIKSCFVFLNISPSTLLAPLSLLIYSGLPIWIAKGTGEGVNFRYYNIGGTVIVSRSAFYKGNCQALHGQRSRSL